MTEQEDAIAMLATTNHTYQQIVEALGVTRQVVKNAVAAAKRETGASGKAELWYALTYGKTFYRPDLEATE